MAVINLNESLSELKEYLPLNMRNSYFEIMFENLLLVEETEFYNNAIVNLTHFYNFVLHCLLLQVYFSEENRVLLKYLQKTTGSLNSRDNDKIINLEERFDLKTFCNIEKDSIKYFFHILGFCENSHLCQKNQTIFDLRNSAAHLNMDIINKNRFDDFISKIQYNLEALLKKTYKYTKDLIFKELKEAIKENRIDDFLYPQIFEEINPIYCVSLKFYKLFFKYNTFQNVQNNSPLYYMQKYLQEVLSLEHE